MVASRCLLVGAVLALVASLAADAYLATLPSVAGAQARVQALLAQHGGLPVSTPPIRVAAATVAVEDRRFYLHHGLDTLGLLRAGWDVVTTGSPHGGATITEQLAQALYVPTDDSLWSHLEKAGLAVKLERRYTKQAILTMYLNAVYYGDGQWGIAQASRAYFGVAPTALSWGAASMLAGLPNAPSAYDPLHHYALARQRERVVLIALVNAGALTQAAAAAIDAQPPPLAARPRAG
jgi:membrane peptidoglycan carboxypeptidase